MHCSNVSLWDRLSPDLTLTYRTSLRVARAAALATACPASRVLFPSSVEHLIFLDQRHLLTYRDTANVGSRTLGDRSLRNGWQQAARVLKCGQKRAETIRACRTSRKICGRIARVRRIPWREALPWRPALSRALCRAEV